MKPRFAIPLTIALLGISSWLSGPVRFNVYYLIVAITALWVAVDSKRLGIQSYQTRLGLPPLALAALHVIVWPIAFPVYLRTRDRIRRGLIAPGPYEGDRLRPVLVVLGVLVVFAAALYFPNRKALAPLYPVANGISQKFGVPVNVNATGTSLTITLPREAVPDSLRADYSRQIASCVKELYSETLNRVTVSYSEVVQRGAITTTMMQPDSTLWGSDLVAGCPQNHAARIGVPIPK